MQVSFRVTATTHIATISRLSGKGIATESVVIGIGEGVGKENSLLCFTCYFPDFCPAHTKFNLKWNRTVLDNIVYRNCLEVDASLRGEMCFILSHSVPLVFFWSHVLLNRIFPPLAGLT